MKNKTSNTFIVLGTVFLVLGFSKGGAFLGLGFAFLAIGIAQQVREKRAGRSK